jgi:hypothetical protein
VNDAEKAQEYERIESAYRLETRAGGIQPVIKLLGVSQARWYDYRAGRVAMPPYIQASIRAHLALSDRKLKEFT